MPGVPEYDAFGREIGEEPLKGFGMPAPAPARAPAQPAPAAEPREAPPEPVAPPREPVRPPRRQRRPGAAVSWILVVVVLGAALIAVGNVGMEVGGGVQDIVDQAPSTEAAP